MTSMLRMIAFSVCLAGSAWSLAEELPRPVALVTTGDGLVAAANRDGTIALLDPERMEVVANTSIGKRLSDLIAVSHDRFFALDEQSHELLTLAYSDRTFRRVGAIALSPYPVQVRYSAAKRLAVATSLWSRRVTILDCAEIDQPRVTKTIDLDFAPRCVAILPGDEKAIASDSFGGRLAILDLTAGKLEFEREYPGNSARALVLSRDGKSIGAVHSMLNPHAHVNKSDIHWGLLMANDLRWMSIEGLLDRTGQIYAGGRVQPLGVPGKGGGDPAGLAVTKNGTVIAALGGVNQVMWGNDDEIGLRSIKVGKRPTAIMLSQDERSAYVANASSCSVSVIDMEQGENRGEISLAAGRERTLLQRGEEAFYDARYSHEGWMSCHSCHSDGHTNFGRNDNLSDGGFGAPKTVISLLGRTHTAPFAWSGAVGTLREQVRNSIEKTMQTDREEIPEEDVSAITAYLESLPPPPSRDRLRGTLDTAAVARGKQVFEAKDCKQCHAGPGYTSSETYDVDLADELGKKAFNPPSLSGVSQRDVFLHDGRAKSLREVFEKYGHPRTTQWTSKELDDLSAFLMSLE